MKNVKELRKILSEEIVRHRAKETNASSLSAISNASGKILTSVKLEMEYRKLLGETPKIEFFGK